MSFVGYVLVNYRWVFVCCFLLPVSFVYDIWMYIRNWVVFRLSSAPRNHLRKVQHVQNQVNEWIKQGRKLKMCTARPGWQTISFRRPKYKSTSFKVQVNLVDILRIDTERRVVRVEPMVTMGQLTATLNPLGWTIPVLPEIDDLTVGGLVMGTGVESSSHLYGLFQHTCVRYELVLADGSVADCSEEENSDLYYSVPWSYGTVGFLTAVDIRLMPAKKYVRVNYAPVRGPGAPTDEFARAAARVPASGFVEALVFGEDEAVIVTGDMTDECEPGKVNNIGRWHKPWFFAHVRDKLRGGAVVEYIPLRDYYHRHTRSLFWELQDVIPFGNHFLFRWLLGWMMPPKVSLLKLTQTKAVTELYENNHIIQDMLVPIDKLKESVSVFHNLVKVYPLWLCPFVLPRNPGMVHPRGGGPQMYVDIGVYGVPRVPAFEPRQTTRAIERHVASVDGFQMLYADTYASRAEFRGMFDHSLYDRVRARLGCERAFPEVHDKVCRAARM